MKKIVFFLLWLMSLPVAQAQVVVDLSTGKETNRPAAAPAVSISETADGYEITYDFTTATYTVVDAVNNLVKWEIPGFTSDGQPGFPELPRKSDAIALTRLNSATVSVVEADFVELKSKVIPSAEHLMESSNASEAYRAPITPYAGYYPSLNATLENIQTYRDVPIAYISVAPIQYNYSDGTVRICKRLTYQVRGGSAPQAISAYNEGIRHEVATDDPFLSGFTLNWNAESAPAMTTADLGFTNLEKAWLDEYLIITTPKFYEAAEEFATWKRKFGFKVYVVTSNSWTIQNVKEKIDSYWKTQQYLKYLLIVGDIEDVPAQTFNSEYDAKLYVSDLPYACMDGTADIVPDVYYGRIPVKTPQEAKVVFDKIIKYEQNPAISSKYYKNSLHCAYFQSDFSPYTYESRRFAQTADEILTKAKSKGFTAQRCYFTDSYVNPLRWHEERIAIGMGNNGLMYTSFGDSIDTSMRKPTFSWTTSGNEIVSGFNDGRLYALYRGHGSETEWWKSGFDVSCIPSLTNKSMLPVVFSICCLTGRYDYETDCLAEAMLKKDGGGCVSIIAATYTSWSGYNDVYSFGLFKSIWNEVLPTKYELQLNQAQTASSIMGVMHNNALAQVRTVYGTTAPKLKETHRLFHCFGDPSMAMYTEAPNVFSVKPTISVDLQAHQLTFTVPTGYDACVYEQGLNKTRVFYGNVTYTYDDLRYVTICFKAPNKRPYIWEGSPSVAELPNTGNRQAKAGMFDETGNDLAYTLENRILSILSADSSTQVCVFSYTGETVMNCKGEDCGSIDLNRLSKGVYVLKISNDYGEKVVKIVI